MIQGLNYTSALTLTGRVILTPSSPLPRFFYQRMFSLSLSRSHTQWPPTVQRICSNPFFYARHFAQFQHPPSSQTAPARDPQVTLTQRSLPANNNVDHVFKEALEKLRAGQWERFQTGNEDLGTKRDSKGKSFFEFLINEADHAVITSAYRQLGENVIGKWAGDTLAKGIHLAVRNDDNYLIAFLNYVCDKHALDERGYTPLFTAIELGKDRCVETLLANFVEDLHCDFGGAKVSSLTFAIAQGKLQCVHLLINKWKSVDSKMPKVGNTLHVAVRYQQNAILNYLLTTHWKASKPLLDGIEEEKTPLGLAASLGNVEAAKILLRCEQTLDPERTRPAGLRSPMDIAIEKGQTRMVEFLFRSGVTINVANYQTLLSGKSQVFKNFIKSLVDIQNGGGTQPPDYVRIPPTGLVLRGGGPKGIAHIGALRILQEKEILDGVVRVAGTSAGAIVGALLSVNYSVKDIEKMLCEKPLLEILDIRGDSDQKLAALVPEVLERWQKDGWSHGVWLALQHPISSIELLMQLAGESGLASGDELRRWLDQQLSTQTGRTNTTLKELALLVQTNGFRHFSAYATEITPYHRPVLFSSERLTPETKDITLASLVAASAAVPGLFSPAILWFKTGGSLYRDPQERHFVDGGLIRNYPIDIWDHQRYIAPPISTLMVGDKPVFNEQTLGLNLYSSTNPIDSPYPDTETPITRIVRSIGRVYKDAEYHLRDTYNRFRTIDIDTKDVKLTDFDLSEDKQTDLIKAGERAAKAFFDKFDQQSMPYAVCNPRVVANFPNIGKVYMFPENIVMKVSEWLNVGEWQRGTPTRVYAISGLPYSGKSELAYHVSQQHQDRFAFIYRIQGDTLETRSASYQHLCDILGVTITDPSPKKIEEALFNRLGGYEFSQPWLLVYDNIAESINFPLQGGIVIATSWQKDLWPDSHRFDIPFLTLPAGYESYRDPRLEGGENGKTEAVMLLEPDHDIIKVWRPFLDMIVSMDGTEQGSQLTDALTFCTALGDLPCAQKSGFSVTAKDWVIDWFRRHDKPPADWVIVGRANDFVKRLHNYGLLHEVDNHFYIFPHARLMILSCLGHRSNTVDTLLETANQIDEYGCRIRFQDAPSDYRLCQQIKAYLEQPLNPVNAFDRARLFINLGNVQHSLLHYTEAYDNFQHGIHAVSEIQDPRQKIRARAELAKVWNIVNRIVLHLVACTETAHSLKTALHSSPSRLTYSKIYECIKGCDGLFPPYLSALERVIEEAKEEQVAPDEVINYLQLISNALTRSQRGNRLLNRLFGKAPKREYNQVLEDAHHLSERSSIDQEDVPDALGVRLSGYLAKVSQLIVADLEHDQSLTERIDETIGHFGKISSQHREVVAFYLEGISRSLAQQQHYGGAIYHGEQALRLFAEKQELSGHYNQLEARILHWKESLPRRT